MNTVTKLLDLPTFYWGVYVCLPAVLVLILANKHYRKTKSTVAKVLGYLALAVLFTTGLFVVWGNIIRQLFL